MKSKDNLPNVFYQYRKLDPKIIRTEVDLASYIKPVQLTKKQIFDLQFKWWNLVQGFLQSNLIHKENYWEDPTFWSMITFFKSLDEDFMKEYKDQLDWKIISKYQYKLSEGFITEFKDYLDLDVVLMNIRKTNKLYYYFTSGQTGESDRFYSEEFENIVNGWIIEKENQKKETL